MKRNIERVFIFILGFTLAWVYIGMRSSTDPKPAIINVYNPTVRPLLTDQHEADKNVGEIKVSTLSNYEVAEKLLLSGKVDEFMQLYAMLRSAEQESANAKYKQLIMRQITQLNEKNQKTEAYVLLKAYLEFEFDDVGGLMLLARFDRAQGNYLAAIDTMYKARSYAHQIDDIDEASRSIRSLVSEYKQRLNKADDSLALLELYGRLTELEPDYALNYIGLAQAHMALGNNEDARRALSLASFDPEVSDKTQKLLNIINQKPALNIDNTTAVSLLRSGDQFAADAVLNNSVQVLLLLDTGASLSIISSDTLARLGLSPDQAERIGWFNTANGVVQAPIMSLAEFTVGGHMVENIDVAIMDVSASGAIDGLLGMNFLKHFKFYIDQSENTLHLQLR